jgi:hypothetical protein
MSRKGREDWVMQHMGFSNRDLGVVILNSTQIFNFQNFAVKWNPSLYAVAETMIIEM